MMSQSGNCSGHIPGIDRDVEAEFDFGPFKSIDVIRVPTERDSGLVIKDACMERSVVSLGYGLAVD
jgi:hypothetical protein